jgi:hypothetical protein
MIIKSLYICLSFEFFKKLLFLFNNLKTFVNFLNKNISMEVAHEIEDRQTPLEKRYLPFISEIRDPGAKYQIAKEISGSVPERSSEHRPKLQEMVDPHQGFIDSYNTRAAAEHRQKMKSQSQELYNENGQRYGRVWDYEGFKNVHDPLSKYYKQFIYLFFRHF